MNKYRLSIFKWLPYWSDSRVAQKNLEVTLESLFQMLFFQDLVLLYVICIYIYIWKCIFICESKLFDWSSTARSVCNESMFAQFRVAHGWCGILRNTYIYLYGPFWYLLYLQISYLTTHIPYRKLSGWLLYLLIIEKPLNNLCTHFNKLSKYTWSYHL